MPRIARAKQRRVGQNRAKSAFQNECQYALALVQAESMIGGFKDAEFLLFGLQG